MSKDNVETVEENTAEEVTPEAPETKETPAAEVTKTEPGETVEELKAKLEEWKKFSRSHEDEKKQLLAEKETWNKARETYESKLNKTLSELEEKSATLTKIQVDNLRQNTANAYKLPAEALPLLRGTTEDELKNEAELLAKLRGFTPERQPLVIKSQGTEKTNAKPSDPIEAMKAWQATALKK